MSETDYTYILAKWTRGKFYLPSIGFPPQKHLRAKKLKTNTNRGSAAKSYQENWAWKLRRVKWLCILWPFQSILFLLEARKSTKILNWKKIPHWNWRSELDASLCTDRVWKPSRIIRKRYDEKQNVSSSEHELIKLFRSAASMNRTNPIHILECGASTMLYFR